MANSITMVMSIFAAFLLVYTWFSGLDFGQCRILPEKDILNTGYQFHVFIYLFSCILGKHCDSTNEHGSGKTERTRRNLLFIPTKF